MSTRSGDNTTRDAERARADDPAGDSAWLEASREEIAEILADLERYRMPFGRFGPDEFPPDGVPLYDLPVEYLMYFEKSGGFPRGKLGRLMRFVFAVKMDGAEAIFAPLRRRAGGRTRLTKRRPGWPPTAHGD